MKPHGHLARRPTIGLTPDVEDAAGGEAPQQRGIQKNAGFRMSVQDNLAGTGCRQPCLPLQHEIR